jgi:selenocysteine lyase/cysteine desulfurase
MTEVGAYLRNLVVGVNEKVPLLNGKYVTAINFDNAATTPPFYSVMRKINDFAPWYASIHRGAGYKSVVSSDIFEEGRAVIQKFVNADSTRDVVIYTKNTTEAINMLSYILFQDDKNQIILSSEMEHLANDLPWRDKFKIDYISINQHGAISLEDLELKLIKYDGKVKLVTVTGASNVTGYINPIYKIARLVHKYGAKILVDGAQLVPHCPIDMQPYESQEHIDYLVFSAHKMYAPFGVGVLIGPKGIFERGKPVYQGGGAVTLVSRQFVAWDNPPHKDEAGTPNAMGVVALIAAIQTLEHVGMQVVHEYEEQLINYTIEGLKCIDDIKLYCCTKEKEDRVSIIAFTIPGINHELVAEKLSCEAGISVRTGLFCAHPYVEKLLQLSTQELEYYKNNQGVSCPGLVRISLGLYNNYQEIDIMIDLLKWIASNKKVCKQKYSPRPRRKGAR